MKLVTVAEAIAAEIDEPILGIRGTLTRLYDQMSGQGQFGDWTLQNGTLKDETGEIKLTFSNYEKLDKAKLLNKAVELRCTKSSKGGWGGIKRTVNKKDKADMLQLTSMAEVILLEPETPTSNGQAKASSSPADASQPAAKANTFPPMPQTPTEPRKNVAELMKDGLAEMLQIANAQYAAITTVHEYLVPLCKSRGITVDAQQEAALVQNLLIQLYYQKGHWKFPGKRLGVKADSTPAPQPPPPGPAEADLDQSGPEHPF